MSQTDISVARIGSTHTVATGERELIDKFVYHLMTGDVCVVPNVFDICAQFPKYREKYLNLYRKHHEPETKKGTVSEDVQIIQGMALDGDFVGYNLETGVSSLYTGDFDRVQQLTGKVVNPALTVPKNLEGIIHCVRLDIDYENEKKFSIKATGLTFKTNLTEENTVFIPYWVIKSMVRVLRSLLKSNKALQITQAVGMGVLKTRNVSLNARVIRQFSDKFLTEIPKVRSFPMNFLVYLPTLGAPSTSLGLTRIDLLKIENIKGIKDVSTLNIAPLNPDPLNSLLQNELLGTYLETLFVKEFDENGVEVINKEKLQKREELVTVMRQYGADVDMNSGIFTLIQATHAMTAEGVLGVWSVLPEKWHRFLMKAKSSITNLTSVPTSNIGYGFMKDLLGKHIVMLTYLTKGTKFRRVIVTNNEHFLEELYGERYRIHFESDMVKARKAVDILRTTGDITEVNRKLGIQIQECDIDGFISEIERIQAEKDDKSGFGATGKTGYISARSLFQPKGSKKFYQNIPIERIQTVTVLSH